MSSSIKNDGEKKKFLFDTVDFDKDTTLPEGAVYTEEQLIVAKMQALQLGKADGIKEARASQEEQALKCFQHIIALLEQLILAEDKREIQKMMDTVRLTARVTHKLLPRFAERFSMNEIERVITEAIEARRDEPRIAITVPTQHMDALKAGIDTLAAQKGYAGKVILLSDDAMSPSDVRVEWADGGAERLYERLYAQIESEFAKAIAGMQSTIKDANN